MKFAISVLVAGVSVALMIVPPAYCMAMSPPLLPFYRWLSFTKMLSFFVSFYRSENALILAAILPLAVVH
jgi:hypothetical protein